MKYSIKQVAELTHLTPYTLRYYEREGLIPSVDRNKSGMRRFTEEDLEWLSLICCLKSTGMSIKQIKEFVDLNKAGECTLKQRYEMLIEHKKSVEDQIEIMQKHLKKVDHKIEWILSQYRQYEAREINHVEG